MKRIGNARIVLFFTVLTFVLTVGVVYAWERVLMSPLYLYYERSYPGPENAEYRWRMAQRIEHFFISVIVDVVVVTLLLRLVNSKQRRLELSEERYRTLFEQAADGIAVIAATDHRIVEVNDRFAEMLGFKADELFGRPASEVLKFWGEAGPGGPLPLDRASGAPQDFQTWSGDRELSIETSSGKMLPVSASCGRLKTDREALFILIIHDLSETRRFESDRRNMERQLFESARLASLGELSAGVAHEINNPLNCIVNFAELLKMDRVARNPVEEKMLQGIIDEGDRIAGIVRDLLTFARRSSDVLGPVSLPPVIDNSLSLFGRQLARDGIVVEVDISEEVSSVLADPSRLRQVVVNMISNSRHALEASQSDEKVIRISAQNFDDRGQDWVRLEFYDNGVGMRQDIIDKVFDPFFTTRRDSGGTGLGLSLSFGIIRDFGGTITVESQEGCFTKFIVTLPAARSPEPEYAKNLASR